ncbi:MAG TPA: cell wall-binding repeat-containing protein, partial [Actinobacteria bacterium]|nr:cell wall-binding repeat-containing protein [Actinomycetota bacterium]
MRHAATMTRGVAHRVTCVILVALLSLTGAAPALAAGITALTPAAAPAPLPTTYTPPSAELAGPDRVATAVRIAQEGWKTSEYVVIATSMNFPDALAGSPLAYALGAPLLLTPPASLAPAVAAEIKALGATRAVVLGGTGALSAAVIDGLAAAGIPRANIERIAGADRYETARDIAARLRQAAGAPSGVVIASGTSYPDALAAAGFAARSNRPILLTAASALPEPTRQALVAAGTQDAIIVGGVAAVSEAVATQLTDPVRIGGADRYETATMIAEYAFAAGVMGYEEIVVATGESFPDALAAGPYAAKTRATLVLTRTASMPVSTGSFLGAHTSATKRIVFLGGIAAIKADTRTA